MSKNKLTLVLVKTLLAEFRLDNPHVMGDDVELLEQALRLLSYDEAPVSQDPAAAWDQLRAQLWGARSGCEDAWQKMSKDIKGVSRDLMAQAVQVSMVDGKVRVNFAREFYLNNRAACHSTIGYWVAAARHLGHTSRPGKRDDGSGYVEFSLEPAD